MGDEQETKDLIELRKQYDDTYLGLNEYLGLGKNRSVGDDKTKVVKPARTVKSTPTPPESRDFELEDVNTNVDTEGFSCGACGESLDSEVAHCPHCGVKLSWEE